MLTRARGDTDPIPCTPAVSPVCSASSHLFAPAQSLHVNPGSTCSGTQTPAYIPAPVLPHPSHPCLRPTAWAHDVELSGSGPVRRMSMRRECNGRLYSCHSHIPVSFGPPAALRPRVFDAQPTSPHFPPPPLHRWFAEMVCMLRTPASLVAPLPPPSLPRRPRLVRSYMDNTLRTSPAKPLASHGMPPPPAKARSEGGTGQLV